MQKIDSGLWRFRIVRKCFAKNSVREAQRGAKMDGNSYGESRQTEGQNWREDLSWQRSYWGMSRETFSSLLTGKCSERNRFWTWRARQKCEFIAWELAAR